MLAAEIPSLENGGVAKDGLSVTWKLKQGVKWHDGQPFTADDCVFNWQYAADPATAATTIGSYQDINVVKIDDYTFRVEFEKPTPFWADAFVGDHRHAAPQARLRTIQGRPNRARRRRTWHPIGTGPYLFVGFKPGDLVQGKLNPDYHHGEPAVLRHHRDEGRRRCRVGRARCDADRRVRFRLEHAGRGRDPEATGDRRQGPRRDHRHAATSSISQLNITDPWKEVDGERSSLKTKHPFLADPAVRNALNVLVDRASVHKFIYGRTGFDTANFVNNPKRFASKNTHYEFRHRQGDQAAGRRWLEARVRRRAREERREAACCLPDLDQRAAPEDPGDRQAGLSEGRHLGRDQERYGVGFLLVGRR